MKTLNVFSRILLATVCLASVVVASPQDEWVGKLNSANDKDFITLANKLSAEGVQSSQLQKILADKLNSKNINLRAACVDAIPYLGEPSDEIINSIFDSMATREITMPDAIPYINIAAAALVKIGDKAMPIAMERVSTDNQHVYAGTMDYFHQMGKASKQTVPTLIENIKPGKNLWPTVYALAGIGKDSAPSIDRLIELLDDPKFNTVCIACRALASIGPAARKAKPKLLEVLEKGNVSERGWALEALGGIGVANSKDVKPLFEDNLKAFHQSICDRAMRGIGYLSPEKAQQFIPLVVDAIYRPQYKNKPLAAFVLYKIGGSKELVRKTLVESLYNPVYEVDVLKKLGQMGSDARESIHVLVPYLDSKDDYLQALVVESLAGIGIDEKTRIKIEGIAANSGYLASRKAKEVLKTLPKK